MLEGTDTLEETGIAVEDQEDIKSDTQEVTTREERTTNSGTQTAEIDKIPPLSKDELRKFLEDDIEAKFHEPQREVKLAKLTDEDLQQIIQSLGLKTDAQRAGFLTSIHNLREFLELPIITDKFSSDSKARNDWKRETPQITGPNEALFEQVYEHNQLRGASLSPIKWAFTSLNLIYKDRDPKIYAMITQELTILDDFLKEKTPEELPQNIEDLEVEDYRDEWINTHAKPQVIRPTDARGHMQSLYNMLNDEHKIEFIQHNIDSIVKILNAIAGNPPEDQLETIMVT